MNNIKKKVVVALVALGTVGLVGCNETEYKAYVDAKAAIAKSAGEQEVNRLIALTKIAEQSNDPAAKTAAIMAIAFSVQKNAPDVAMPQNTALQWAQVLSPIASTGLSGLFNYKLGVVQSDNSVKTEGIRYGAMSNIAGAGINGAVQLGSQGITGVSNLAIANQELSKAEAEAMAAEYAAAAQ